jgi:hypothetical protein
MAKGIYPPDIFLSPNLVITRMNQLVQKYGVAKATTDGQFKEEREAAITALFILGYRILLQRDFWIGIPQDDPPDNIIVSPQKRVNGRGLEKYFRNVEVFEWEGHSQNTLPQAIREKLNGKKYPEDYYLVCQIRRPGDKSNVEDWVQDLQRNKPGVSEVWIVSSIENDSFDHVISRLYPNIAEQRFRLLEQLDASKSQVPCLREMGRGIMDKPEPTHDAHLPLP